MKRTTLIAVASMLVMAACVKPTPVPGRADNDMLRFSAMNYVQTGETTVQ